MSQGEFENRWMAYIDGQLSTGEASALDASLDDEARVRIEGEVRFEAALSERLSSGPDCPAELWRATLAKIESSPRPRIVVFRRRLASMAAAAGIVLSAGFAASYLAGRSQETVAPVDFPVLAEATMTRLGISEDTVSDFALRAKTPCSPKAIENYLSDHDIQLAVAGDKVGAAGQTHRVRLLGSCMGNCPKGEIVEVLFDFDGAPAKLVLARASSGGAKLIRSEENKGTVIKTKVIGDYVAGVVSRGQNAKDTEMLLDMIRVKNEQIARQIHVNQKLSTVVS